MTPILFNSRKRGSIVTCAGITIDAISVLNRLRRPRNRYLANANPAIELITREISVTATDTTALFTRYLAMFNRVKRLAYCSSVGDDGRNGGGNVLASPDCMNEAETIHASGVSVATPITRRTACRAG